MIKKSTRNPLVKEKSYLIKEIYGESCLDEVVLDGFHDDVLYIAEGEEGQQRHEVGDADGTVNLRQLLQEPEHRYLST